MSGAAAAVVESAWLAALVIVPIFFNVHSVRTFEEDKIPLLRSIAVLILIGLVVWVLEEGRRAWTIGRQPVWRLPLVRPTLLLAAAYVVSTLFSIAPHVSIWGSYERAQGTYTTLGYLTIFAAIILLVRTRPQVERLVTTILLASFPPAVYAIVQHFGYDPIRWGLDVTVRAHGTAGNPIFLGAFLIMVVPLTAARALEHLARLRRPSSHRLGAAVAFATCLLLLVLLGLAIVFSASRGPFVGLGAGMFLSVLLLARLQRRRRSIMAITGLAALGLLFLLVLNVKGGPLKSLRQTRYLAPLGRLFDAGSGTGRVRVVIWEGAVNLLAADPLRDLIGYGPETLYLAYTPFYPPELARYEGRRVAPDRAHNEVFDALIMTGLLGLAAELTVFVAFFYWVLRWLGLLRSEVHRRVFFGLLAATGTLGVLLPYVIDGSLRFAGVGFPLGIVVGLLAFVIVGGIMDREPPARPPNLILLGLAGAVLAHFVEIQFGIAVAASRLLFWVFAALAVSVGVTLSPEVPAQRTDSAGTEPRTPPPNHINTGLSVGLILVLLTFDFYRPELDVYLARVTFLALFLGTWGFGVLLATGDGFRPSARNLAAYTALSLGTWLPFLIFYAWWLSLRVHGSVGLDQVLAVSRHVVNVISVLYVTVLALILIGAAVRWLADRPPPAARGRWLDWRLAISAMLLLAAIPVVIVTNLNVSRADIFCKQIGFYGGRRRAEAALLVAREAARLQPMEDHYATRIVQVLMNRARRAPDRRDEYLRQAQETLDDALRYNPLNMDNTRNLARLHRLWAALEATPAAQARHLDEADHYYKRATALSPHNASLWNEWALLYGERGRVDEALPLLNHSLEIDDGYTTTYWMRANIYESTGSPELALQDYNRALKINPKLLAAWSGKALVLARLNRLDEAIAANRAALRVAPNDLISHRNLALLYQRTDRLDLSLKEARAALKVAKSAKDKEGLEAFIHDLEPAMSQAK